MGIFTTNSVGHVLDDAQAAADAAVLEALGYKQELKRGMSLFANFAISFSIITVLTGITGPFGTALTYGGPMSAVWGWPITAMMSMFVALAMAEICSAYPTCGGLYFWSARLAGPRWAPLASWVTGWFNLLGQVAVTAGVAFSFVTFCCTFITMATGGANGGGITFDTKQMLGIYGGVLGLCGLLNSGPIQIIATLNDISAWWHVLGTIFIVVFLPSAAPSKQSASWALTEFADNSATTGVYNPGYIFFLGLLMSQWTLTGFDASAHMSEETVNAAMNGPLGIISAVGVSAIFGWAYIIALVFCIQGDPANLFNPDSASGGGLPVFQIFWDVFQAKFGSGKLSLILAVFPLMAGFFATASSVGSNSRMLYAFSRDGAVPGSKLWSKINPTIQAPVNAVWGMVFAAFALGTPMLNNIQTFTAVTSIATIGLYISYALPIFLKLIIARHSHWQPGPFHLGRYSSFVGIVAILWVAFISVLFCLPPMYPITVNTFNYAPVAVGIVLVICFGFWWLPFVGACHWFQGPPHASDAHIDFDVETNKDVDFEAPVKKAATVMAPTAHLGGDDTAHGGNLVHLS